jgi:hypothetical protein
LSILIKVMIRLAGEKTEASFSPSRLLRFRNYCDAVKLLVAILALLACLRITAPAQSVPPPAQSVSPFSSSYGAYPENYQEIITNWLNSSLVDPRSVLIKWLSEPKPGELPVDKAGKTVSGFVVDFSVNARNLFGAYTGPQKHTALIRDGQVVTATGFVFH